MYCSVWCDINCADSVCWMRSLESIKTELYLEESSSFSKQRPFSARTVSAHTLPWSQPCNSGRYRPPDLRLSAWTFCVTGFWLCISECYRRFNQTHFRSASKLSGACIAGEIVCLCAWEFWQRSRHSPLLAARGKLKASLPHSPRCFQTILP